MPRGYDRPLYILPFDHRGSFQAVAAIAGRYREFVDLFEGRASSVARPLTDRVRSEHRSSREG
jgi:hypothetical protein